MSPTLVAPDSMQLKEIAYLLRREDVSVSTVCLDGNIDGNAIDAATGLVILISEETRSINLGEQVDQVRRAIGTQGNLVLCVPIKHQSLSRYGAEIITPVSRKPADVVERILAHLIVKGYFQRDNCGALHGATKRMRELYSDIEKLAPLEMPILILGETGTGKELVAQELHLQSDRPRDDFLAINLAELNPNLIESELFGHEKGAFNNALKRVGLLVEAGPGTLLLDEIGELDLPLQTKLLRVLERREVRPVGANHWEKVKARIILATNRNLEEEAQEGRFRRDLLARIRGYTFELPPLCERKADIPLLVQHFVEAYNTEHKTSLKIRPGSLEVLFRYDWPDNLRELREAVEKAAVYAEGGYISTLILQQAIHRPIRSKPQNVFPFDPSSHSWKDFLKQAARVYFEAILKEAQGNKEKARRVSQLSKAHFYKRLKDFGLS